MSEILLTPIPRPVEAAADSPAARLNLGLRPALLLVVCAALAGMFVLTLALGSVQIPLNEVLTVLAGGEASRTSWTNIVLKFRLPKAITAALAGAALGASGLMMQTFFRNPLADPFVLGISSGASLGVALVVLSAGTVGGTLLAGFGLSGDLLLAAAAAAGAGVSLLGVLLVAQRVHNSMTLLILGLMSGYLVSAVVSLLLYFTVPERIQAYITWTFGSFGGVTWDQIPILGAAVAVGLGIALTLTKSLNALLLGEVYARSLGIHLIPLRTVLILATALLAGAVTAFCGPIGFIGVAVPHLCRALFQTSDHRLLLPGAILMGATTALFAGLVAEVPGSPLILPLNAITALIGAPVVIVVLLRQRTLNAVFAA